MNPAIAERAASARAAERAGHLRTAVDLWHGVTEESDDVRWALRLAVALGRSDREAEAKPLFAAAARTARAAGLETAALVAWLAGDLDGASAEFADADALPLLGALSVEAFDSLLPSLSRRALAPGEVLIHEGNRAQALYLLAEGSVEVVRRDEKAGEFRLGVLGSGAVLGEMALILDKPRTASVRALEECELLRVEIDGLRRAAGASTAVESALERFTDQRLLNAVVGSSPLLRGVPPSARDELIAEFATTQVVAGTRIVTEGEPGGGIYVIVTGHARVKRLDEGREITLAELGPGDVFGEISLLSDGAATASVTADEDTTLRRLDAAAFAALCERHPTVRDHITRLGAGRVAENRFIFEDDEFIEAAY